MSSDVLQKGRQSVHSTPTVHIHTSKTISWDLEELFLQIFAYHHKMTDQVIGVTIHF